MIIQSVNLLIFLKGKITFKSKQFFLKIELKIVKYDIIGRSDCRKQ
jgi:hypothetical protein